MKPVISAEELLEHAPRMENLALRILRNREDAEDARQEALYQAWRNRGGFENRAKLGTWLGRIVINEALSELRMRKVRKHVSLDEPETGVGDALTRPEPSVLMALQVRRAMRRLPPMYRRALVMQYWHGLEQQEIATRLRMPLGTVKSHQRRGLAMLRKELLV